MIDATVKRDLARAARARAADAPANPEDALYAGTQALIRRIALTYAAIVLTVAALVTGAATVLARSEPPPPPAVTSLVVTSLMVTPSQATVDPGDTLRLAAVANFSDDSNRDVTALAEWQSRVPEVATVDDSGTAAGAAPGTSVITATWADRSGNMSITVPDPTVPVTVTALDISPQAAELTTGQTQLFTAVATRSDGSSQQVSDNITWDSSDLAIASVAPGGELTARSAGSATITASFSDLVARTPLTVRDPDAALVAITVTPEQTVLVTGATQQLTAFATYNDGRSVDITDRATWQTGIPTVATVDDVGEIRGVSTGSTTVTATLSGQSANVTVTVEESEPTLTGLNVTVKDTNFFEGVPGCQVQLKAERLYDKPTNKANDNTPDAVTWSSDNESIAKVDDTGIVTISEDEATTTITAKVGDITGTAEVSCRSDPVVE